MKLIKSLLRALLVLFVLVNIITAFHAYKFTHFYNPGSIAAKKQADKNGWDITKEILFGINVEKKKEGAIADSASQTVHLITNDRIAIEGWYFKTASTARGTAILFHGHGACKIDILKESAAFQKMGYNTLLIDFRAHGNSGGNTSTIGYYETEEVKLAYDYIKNKGEKNILLWGISMGAATICKAMNDYPLQPSKIILEMPFGSILEAAGGRIKMMGIPPQPLATLITFWGGVEHGFWAFNMKPSEYAKNIHCPVLLQWGQNDPRVSRHEIDMIYTNLPAAKKLVVYENSGHQSLCSNENEKWVAAMNDFLSK